MSSRDFEELESLGRELYLLEHTMAILGWDQETYLPEAGVEERSEQLAYLEGEYHKRATSDKVGQLFKKLGVDQEHPMGRAAEGDSGGKPGGDRNYEGAFIRYFFRLYSRMKKLPENLVTELAKKTSISQHRWGEARKKSDFSIFAPHLKDILRLTKEKIDYIGYTEHPYDALLDEYEPWEKTENVQRIFSELEGPLSNLVSRIAQVKQVEDSFLYKEYPREKQEAFGMSVLKEVGYDFTRGRLDVSNHPFTTTLGIDDVRLTTRYNENFFNTGFFGSLHEGGHGLYEQGFGEWIRGNLLAAGTSLGIHESQSRTWENMVARGRTFWRGHFPKLKEIFPENLKDIDEETFYRGVNKVEPTLIRVEADEVTYNLHIILRFQLELALVEGELDVDGLPAAWNEKMKKLLKVVPQNDAEGVLQDIHWSMGGMGYFPTYALGNLYSAQFSTAMKKDIPNWEDHIFAGKFDQILNWLRENIHTYGSAETAEEISQRVTGGPLSHHDFLRYVEDKFSDIYGL